MEPLKIPLDRFLEAQSGALEPAMDELRAGRKRTHWMWFIFPQLRVLARSATAQYYGLQSMAEATRYWQHPVLGKRLMACTQLVMRHTGTPIKQILGEVDALKFGSCMTLFERVAADARDMPDVTEVPDVPEFSRALDQFYCGQRDVLTLRAFGAER